MLAMMENALTQFAQTQTKGSECGSFDQRLNHLAAQLGAEPAATKIEAASEQPPQKSDDTAAAMLDLLNIAKQLDQVEEMIEQVTQGGPEGDEAKHYSEIALRALRCSWDLLSKKHARCLAGFQSSILPPAPPGLAQEVPKVEKPSVPKEETPCWMGMSKEAVDACPEFVPMAEANGSLRHDLEMLRERNPERVIIVRKIKKLGFESPAVLTEHFKQYGEVAEVLVAHSHVKSSPKRPNGRVRPAALGFVVMGSEEAALCALQAGSEQMVGGASIELGRFEPFHMQCDEEK